MVLIVIIMIISNLSLDHVKQDGVAPMAKHFRARCSDSTNTWAVLLSFCLHKVNENLIQFGHTYFWENIKIGF